MASSGISVLAFDFGASSGRAILGLFDGKKITAQEVHRFSNDPVLLGGTLYWDFHRLFFEVMHGIAKGKSAADFSSIGIDTWGVDFGLLRKDGSLVDMPVHYRDPRTDSAFKEALHTVGADTLYGITGVQLMPLNTAFQLSAIQRERPYLLDEAAHLLCMPDLFNYFLTGEKRTELSIASTTQLLNITERRWSKELLDALHIPERLFTDIVPSGTIIGQLKPSVCEGITGKPVTVTAVCGHDTQSAITAIPAAQDDFAFISCGTWSLFGTERLEPIISPQSLAYNITNEAGYGGKIHFLKNCTGLWLIQESRRQWQREGKNYSFAELEAEAQKAPPFRSFINPNAPEFGTPGNLPERIRRYCERTGQLAPESVGEVMQCIYQSLAFHYKKTLEELQLCTGIHYPCIYMVGGGIQDTYLCRLTADACGRPVSAGPVEASALGNIAVQLIAAGAISGIKEARRIIAASYPPVQYTPEQTSGWEAHYAQFLCTLQTDVKNS